MCENELLQMSIQCGAPAGENNPKMMTAVAWIKCLLNGNSPIEQLRRKGINEIIVYGIMELGELFVQEALKEGYKVLGITDRKIIFGQYYFENIPIMTREELSINQDKYIIVTAVGFWREIRADLNQMGCHKVIVLWELL